MRGRARPAALLSAALLLTACSGDETPQVRVAEVARGTVAEVVDAPGTVAARASATVTAPADATVEAVLVPDGKPVVAGEILLRLVSPEAQQRLRQAEAAAAGAGARLDLPRADLSAVQAQLDEAAEQAFAASRAAAQSSGDPERRAEAERQVAEAEQRYRTASAAARAAVQQANAGVGQLETALDALGAGQRAQAAAAVTAARAVVDALTVRAPIDGVVTYGTAAAGAPAGGDLSGLLGGLPGELQGAAASALGGASGPSTATTSVALAPGSPVGAGTPLLTLTDVSALTVMAEVDETDVLLVRPGVQATVELDAVPDAVYPASVSGVDVTPSPSAGGGVTYRVRLDLQPGEAGDGQGAPPPLPGMSAVVDLQVRTAEGVLAVPSSAVVRDGADDVVFVLDGGVVRRRPVSLGAQGEDTVEVTEGVAAGDRIVVRDADRLSDGQEVEARP